MQNVTDHLANERTFLSWIRTALALLGFGFVVARVGIFLRQLIPQTAEPAALPSHIHDFIATGVLFLAVGVALAAWSAWRYRVIRNQISNGNFIPAGPSILAVSIGVALAGAAIMVLILLN